MGQEERIILAGATEWRRHRPLRKTTILDLWTQGVERKLFAANHRDYEVWIREWEDVAKQELEGVGLYKDLIGEIVSYL